MNAFDIADEILNLLLNCHPDHYQDKFSISLKIARAFKLKAIDPNIKQAIRLLLNKEFITTNTFGHNKDEEYKITSKGLEFINSGGYKIEHQKEKLMIEHIELSINSIKNQKKISWITLGVAVLTLAALITQIVLNLCRG